MTKHENTPAASTPAASTPAASTPAASTPAASTPPASTRTLTGSQRLRLWTAALVVPLAAVLVASGVIAAITAELPDRIATHWGVGGAPNGFAPSWVAPLLPLLTGGLSALLLAVLIISGAHRARSGPLRLFCALNGGLASLIATISLASVVPQRGLAAAEVASFQFGMLALALCLVPAAAVAGCCWLIAPKLAPLPVGVSLVEPFPVAASERTVWLQHVGLGLTKQMLLMVALLVPMLGMIWAALGSPSAESAAALWAVSGGLLFPLLILVALTSSWHVSAGEHGLSARSAAGWPSIHVPLQAMVSVRVVEVDALTEFGGWGFRLGVNRRFGLIFRSGASIEVERNDGKRTFVLPVADAATGASLLAGLLAQPRP